MHRSLIPPPMEAGSFSFLWHQSAFCYLFYYHFQDATLSAEVEAPALALDFLIFNIHLPLQTVFFCPYVSEVLCLLSISWRNEQVNHQLWGNFLGGAFSVIWDANIYPCSFPEFHPLLCIKPPCFTKKLFQLPWRLDTCYNLHVHLFTLT